MTTNDFAAMTGLELMRRPDFANPLGAVHGGIAATLLDSARAAQTDGTTLTAEGTVIHAGRRTATAEGKVTDNRGELIAHATTTCLILPLTD
ncbi:PaaI family thioesterase [Nonomuraea bangladeshensis]|uniref:PaaI family thioesterase n=1 Tax=Nonomuraea bangladeshensis TaxID=404385 RepID=A0ABV3GZN9_9ACTN